MRLSALLIAQVFFALPASGEEPLSAIDWLSDSLKDRPALTTPMTSRDHLSDSNLWVYSLDKMRLDGIGILSPRQTGLPPDMWNNSKADQLAEALNTMPDTLLPALQAILVRLLITDFTPPAPGKFEGSFLSARVDALLARGYLAQSSALLNEIGVYIPDLFRRLFDVNLLLGREDAACRLMAEVQNSAPSIEAQIFCLARNGDWSAAAILLQANAALGTLSQSQTDLLWSFLDPEFIEEDGPIPAPAHITPLSFRMMEAIGTPLPTAGLALAFAHADLSLKSGWKLRLDAAERLARFGAISPASLMHIYRENKPAASGGAWRRAATLVALESALALGAPEIGIPLQEAWNAFSDAGLAWVLAAHIGPELRGLQGQIGPLEARILLLSDPLNAPSICTAAAAALSTPSFVCQLYNGVATESVPPLVQTILLAFEPDESELPFDKGLALLRAIKNIGDGRGVDPRQLTADLRFLNQMGLHDTAYRVATELLILADGDI